MRDKLKLTVIVEKTGTGFSAYVKEIDGLVTVGDDFTEIKESFIEVLEYYIDFENEKGRVLAFNDFEIEYVVDLEQFFDYFSVINKTAFAQKYANMNPSLFRQYTKGLAPLSDEKLERISDGLHQLADEIKNIRFC